MKRAFVVWLATCAMLLVATPPIRLWADQQASGADERETFTYTVKKGDTLWDISDRLYRDPWVWPKVWQWNPTITNPHWIYPGTELRLYYRVPGTTILAVVPPGALPATSAAVAAPAPSLPPPPVTPSLPPPPVPPRVPTLVFKEIDQVGFITPFRPQGDGRILGEMHDKGLIGQGDEILVQLKLPRQGAVGDRYYVFSTSELIRHPITNQEVGYLNTPLGVVEITGVAPDHAKARVLTSYDAISKGDRLMPYRKRAEEIVLQDGTEPKEGRIVVAKGEIWLSGDRQIVFIDLGADNDVKAGNRFEVYREPRVRAYYEGQAAAVGEEFISSAMSEPVGEILVLSAEKETAAAIVTKTKVELYPGERVRMKTNR
ncbi:MAG TPA: LysM domain-containing protein [Syntrophobacteria bacterium]|nr:LysM domain-containing protein [Syntrophobacteria bacterium]